MARTKKDSKVKRTIAALKAVRGLERQHHFETGGSVSGWLGRHDVRSDRRKEADRTACRRPVQAD